MRHLTAKTPKFLPVAPRKVLRKQAPNSQLSTLSPETDAMASPKHSPDYFAIAAGYDRRYRYNALPGSEAHSPS